MKEIFENVINEEVNIILALDVINEYNEYQLLCVIKKRLGNRKLTISMIKELTGIIFRRIRKEIE